MVLGAVAGVIGSYAVGMFPTAHLVARRRGHDPTREGSGNPGATNVYRVAGRRAGALVGVGDVAKGVVPTSVALLASGRPLACACFAAAVLGHVFPLARGRRGGKGVATAGGGVAVLYPLAAVALIALFALAVTFSRRVSVGSLAMALALPALVAVSGHPSWEVAVAAGVSLLVIVRHIDNIRRLVRHEERTIR